MSNYLKQVFRKIVPQSEPIPGRELEMTLNSNWGYVFPVDDWTRLDRFLILGSEGGSFYATERSLSVENADAVKRAIAGDGLRVVKTIVAVSESGRAPKNGPALFALAMAASFGNDATRAAALNALPRVARIGTHLFQFAAYVDGMRGWGRGLRRAVADWYISKPLGDLAYQAVKYQARDGWSHRDLLRVAHPKAGAAFTVPGDAALAESAAIPNDRRGEAFQRDALFHWIVKGSFGDNRLEDSEAAGLRLIDAFEQARRAPSAREVARLVREQGLTREMIPTEFLDSAEVWEALLERMPLGALVRNLATLTRVGVLVPMAEATAAVVERLGDAEAIRKARLHPIGVLAALLTYKQGHGARSSKQWSPAPQVVDALDRAFYLAFGNIERTGKRFYLSLDVSGSMSQGTVAGVPGLTPRVAAAAMAMTIARVEPRYHMAAFSGGFGGTRYQAHNAAPPRMEPLAISASDSLADVVRKTDGLPFGGTDTALPMLDALARNIAVDVFVVLTDSETWAGAVHPVQALKQYRERTGIPAKLVVVGMVSNGFTIADPNDAGMLDVVGFDTAAPNVITDFAAA
jgi:60 kDa SS-A/Ro ribonucleoprotein